MALTIQTGVLVISDRSWRNERKDDSGPALCKRIIEIGWEVTDTHLVPDVSDMISNVLKEWCDSKRFDLILTTGGTGFAPKDITPEATNAVIERPTPGIVEAIRVHSLSITPHAMLSRAVAGIRGRTLIINFPGSPKAVLENLDVIIPIIPHAIELLRESPTSEAGHGFST
jgi:molybdopterin adenylyltransferase